MVTWTLTPVEVVSALRRLVREGALDEVAADALQLAAALAWAGGGPAGHVVHTLDRRPGLAAQREGFRVVPDPAA